MLRFLDSPIDEADDREARDAGLDVDLHVDATRLEANERMRDRPREHGGTLGEDA